MILCEKSDALGGDFIPGGVPHFKRNARKLIAYYKRQLELLGVDVKYNTAVTKELAAQYNADVIVVATGSKAKKISLPGSAEVVTAEDVLLDKVSCGDKVLMVGGGLVGCETALWLAQQGKEVNVVELLPELLGGHGALPHINEFMLHDLLKYHKVGIYTDTQIVETGNEVTTVKKVGKTIELASETVVLSVGYESDHRDSCLQYWRFPSGT